MLGNTEIAVNRCRTANLGCARCSHEQVECSTKGVSILRRDAEMCLQASLARNAHTRNALRSISTAIRENPATVRRANAEAGETGTKVLRMCPARCSQPSRISNAKNI